jgi:CDP-diacylglycerol--glycerol-3-phosphate 3-phosphatidyltransferase/cardiolipin synthase
MHVLGHASRAQLLRVALAVQAVPAMSDYSVRHLASVPGLLSLSRLGLAAAFVLAVRSSPWSIAILVLAGATDLLDGWFARRFGQETATGAALDAIADKLFVGTVVLALVVSRSLSVPQALLLGVRDVGELVLGAWLLARERSRLWRPHPHHALGRVTTVLQYAAVLSAILGGDTTWTLAFAAGLAGALATVAYGRMERRRRPCEHVSGT